MTLTQNEIEEYLNKHLPYRLNCLMAWDIMMYRQKNNVDKQYVNLPISPYQDSLVIEPAFEISLVFGRALVQFIGISYGKKDKKLKKSNFTEEDDITLKSLFPNRSFCLLTDDDLKENESDIETLFRVANKTVAHLTNTVSNNGEHERLPYARKAIYNLVLKYVPEIPKNKLWYNNEISSPQSNT
jgi:hypothetical protein